MSLQQRKRVAAAALRLRQAMNSAVPCEPVRDLIGTEDLAVAYAVQQILVQHAVDDGARVVGRKIGATSAAVQEQLGVDQPDFGVLLDDMDVTAHELVPIQRLIQPKVEAEVAFMLGADLAEGPLDAAQCRSAVEYAVAAIEIVDSRIAGWDIQFSDTVADNASSGLYVLGTTKLTLAEFEPVAVVMEMTVDGTTVSTGSGDACLGDPLNALRWLARRAREYGQPLRAGQVVLSGALGPMAPARAGSCVSAELSSLGRVAIEFSSPPSGGPPHDPASRRGADL
ncbi:putative hydratase/decarboxylase [Acrocarpospora pleiomorpha]|uniref:Putative hydratase/decarboxylase n=1 Tax=Acrocarpospora pleiomorpha TaxID=90975 RepID=A0A5M3Y478_9ACTN|nr:fumarylacetoacetate hydrolase family protein [Acrocarpospora pleiomorpha]GES25788.1 putative hydratase/decarboxylase [Acrocarpospora pleiomorpha]